MGLVTESIKPAWRQWLLPAFLTYMAIEGLWQHIAANAPVPWWGWVRDACAVLVAVVLWRQSIREQRAQHVRKA